MKELLYLTASKIEPGNLPQTSTGEAKVDIILRVVLGIIGGLALLMLVVSGFRYILSAGDPEKIAKAKNGIIYALVGLAIAIIAQAIVAFVVNRL